MFIEWPPAWLASDIDMGELGVRSPQFGIGDAPPPVRSCFLCLARRFWNQT